MENAEKSRISGRPSPSFAGAGAFSILELLIVALVMSILAAVATPTFFDSLLFHRVESAARRVKADLELARMQARLTSASQSISFAKFHLCAVERKNPGQA